LPRLTFITPDGESHEVEAESGLSVMEAATSNGIPGVLADCGGACACATCHVYVDPTWVDRIPGRSETETDMIECVDDPRPNSRLSCQIMLSDNLDGIILHIPDE
jgi:ferredoxin, 2Fe-2S